MPAATPAVRNGTSRPGWLSWLTTIRARLYRLMTVEDESHRVEIAEEIAQQARNIAAWIKGLRALDASRSTEIDAARIAMIERLGVLNQAVTDRIIISRRRQAMALSVR